MFYIPVVHIRNDFYVLLELCRNRMESFNRVGRKERKCYRDSIGIASATMSSVVCTMKCKMDDKHSVKRKERREEKRSVNEYDRRYTVLGLGGHSFFGCPRLLGLPQVALDGDGVHTGGHSLCRYLAELFPVRVVLIQELNHFGGDALWADTR